MQSLRTKSCFQLSENGARNTEISQLAGRLRLDKPITDCIADQARRRRHACFSHCRSALRFDSLLAAIEYATDFLVAAALGDQLDNDPLARCQRTSCTMIGARNECVNEPCRKVGSKKGSVSCKRLDSRNDIVRPVGFRDEGARPGLEQFADYVVALVYRDCQDLRLRRTCADLAGAARSSRPTMAGSGRLLASRMELSSMSNCRGVHRVADDDRKERGDRFHCR
jgi:hypothetical protein